MGIDKKELIRQSAAYVFANEGYYETTVKAIAEEAGIAVGTVYLYFKTKEEILDYIFLVEHNKRIKYISELESSCKSAIEVLQSFLDFHFNELKENPSISRVLVQEAAAPLMLGSEGIRKYCTKLPDLLAEILVRAKENGEVRDIDTNIVARLIFYMIRNSVYLLQQDNSSDWPDAVKEQLLSLLLRGIQS